MSTATLTPTTAAEQLLSDVRQVLEQHPGADDVDELRSIADELAAVLRKARGRITRIAKRDQPTPTRTPEENRQVSARASDEAGTRPVEPPAPGPAAPRCAPRAVGMHDSTVVFPPVRGRIPLEELPRPEHGKHRPDTAPRPLVAVLTRNGSQWPLGEHHRGEHRQKAPTGRGWKALIAALMLVPLLVLVVAQVKYERQDRVTPWHGVPATTGQTPTPPVAGRGAR